MFSKTTFNSETKIWSGTISEKNLDITKSLGDIIVEALDDQPDEISQISDNSGIRLTRADIKFRALQCAKYIQNQGLKLGDVTVSIARHTHYLAPIIFGAILNGTPVNTLDVNFGKEELVNMFRYTKPKLVFCDADTYDVVKNSLEDLNLKSPICTVRGQIENVYSVEDILRDISDTEANTFVPVKIEDSTKCMAFILCSSGTTGLPKGVCISHAQLLTSPTPQLPGTMNFFCMSPLFWVSGVGVLIGGTVGKGVRIITDEPFSAELMLRIIEQYKVNFLFSPPSYMMSMINSPDIRIRDLSSLRLYMCSGSYLSPSIWNEMAKFITGGIIFTGYLMTETSTGCTLSVPVQKPGSVGQLVFNAQVKIVDDNGKQLGVNENGEICIKAAYNFLGYYGRPDETAKILDAQGWIHSGDLGHFDDEGFLFLVDRKKDVLKYKGYQYTPTEIEEVIQSGFHNEIQEVCVCGIPDPLAADLPAACVVKKNGSKIDEKDIVDYVAKNMSDYKRLRGGVYFLESLPLTTSGKYIRAKVRDISTKLYQEREAKENL